MASPVVKLNERRAGNSLLPDIRSLVVDTERRLDVVPRSDAADCLAWNVLQMARWAEARFTYLGVERDGIIKIYRYPARHDEISDLMERSNLLAKRIAAYLGCPEPDFMPKARPEPQLTAPRKSRSWLATFVRGWRKLIFRSEAA